MWYFTMKKLDALRPILMPYVSEAEANASRARLLEEYPDAEIGIVFEESCEYYSSFPHVIGECTNGDGSINLLWSDGQQTPKPA